MSPAPANVPETLEYRHIRNTALGYVTASSPTSTNPQFIGGQNVLTSYKGYAERRPGFPSGIEITPTTFAGTIRRVFGWRRWASNFYIMLCEVTGSVSNVYKLALGQDSSFSLISTSSSTEPFDFVVSNNFCFFGNGMDMRKFDGTTVTNWGIQAPSAVSTSPTSPTVGANINSATWINPGNITAQDGAFATLSFTSASVQGAVSNGFLAATGFGFAIPSTATITGIVVEIKGFQAGLSPGFGFFSLKLIKAGAVVGNFFSAACPGSNSFVTFGNSSYLWGSTWVPADINASNFGIGIAASIANVGTGNFSADFGRITVYYNNPGSGQPTTSTSGTGITAATGWQYVYSYFNSTTGHLSSPSQPSTTTGAVSNKTVNVGVTASTDPQVDKIRIFRTTDGGGGQYFEIANSPVANATASYPDVTTDANLSVITAPTFGFNDPPTPQKGFVWFANRIWGFNNATLYFTDWEELNIGVAEEASVSGPAGNFWQFDSEVTALSVAQDGVIIFTAGSIYKIDGDSLDTFRRTTIAKGIGCRNRATIARLGALTAFLANTNSVWTTDSNSLQEISREIQPTLDGIDHSQASMAFHIQGQNRWLVLADQGHQQTLVYDTNLSQWMPPWTIQSTALCSAETSEGNWQLLTGNAQSKTMLVMQPGVYTDNNSPYPANAILNPIPLISEHMGEVNQFVDIFYPQAPGRVAYLEYFGMETNAAGNSDLADVSFCHDDDPATAPFTSILASGTNAPKITQGTDIVDKWYYARKPTVRRVAMQISWGATQNNFKWYTMSMGYRIYS